MYKRLLVLLIIGFVGGLDVKSAVDDGIGWDRTWTTAICEGNRCVDYLVYCNGAEVLGIDKISDVVVFGDGWVDKREEKDLC
tara:strand:- start:1572 stop:1817 length:246 start_codon:yes stop_codon:yes gene_type:complete